MLPKDTVTWKRSQLMQRDEHVEIQLSVVFLFLKKEFLPGLVVNNSQITYAFNIL